MTMFSTLTDKKSMVPQPIDDARRALPAGGLALLVALGLAGCGLTPLPGLTFVRLPHAAPGAVPGAAAPAAAADPGVAREPLHLALPVAMPAYLDRETVMVAQGAATLRALPDLRWAEPLRDAVPRVLRIDLQRLLGMPPAQAAPAARRLGVQIQGLELSADQRSLRLRANWSITSAASPASARQGEADFEVPATPGAEGVGLAHRQALARLAESIAATARTP
jgi:uncharacterized lipoprotein YmbA